MSPFVHNPVSNHGRRLLTPPHIRYVEEVRNFHRRTDTFQTSKGSFDDIINRWWVAFAVGGLILIMLLVVAGVALVRCIRRRKSRPLMPGSDINEKENGNGKAITPPFGSIPFFPPPHIMVTPATASPTKLRFSLDTNETLADLADQLKYGTDPELRPDLHGLEYRKSLDSLGESDFDGSETDIVHVRAPGQSLAHQLPRYHGEDPSNTPDHGWENEMLDEVNLHSPGALAGRAGSPGTDTPVTQLLGRVATMLAKHSVQNPPAGQVSIDSDPQTASGSGASEPELTEAELSTLMLQFPPPAYPKTSKPMHQTGEKTLPSRPETDPNGDKYTRHAVRHFAFHRPTMWQNRPDFPRSAASVHTALSPTISGPRPKHSPTSSQAHSWTQARTPINIRGGPVSDRYATRHLAMETGTTPRWSDLQRQENGRKEEEMRDIV